jgi:hypothetical protein
MAYFQVDGKWPAQGKLHAAEDGDGGCLHGVGFVSRALGS